MDPTKSNTEWSAFEIKMVKSLIARYKANKSHTDDMNKKHSDIISEVHAMFPLKERLQVINLYANLIVEMMESTVDNGSYYFVGASRGLVNNNFEIPVKDQAIDNTRVSQEVPLRRFAPCVQRSRTGFWTISEHRFLICKMSFNLLTCTSCDHHFLFVYALFLCDWHIFQVNYYYTCSKCSVGCTS
jgi:hypothetical protein